MHNKYYITFGIYLFNYYYLFYFKLFLKHKYYQEISRFEFNTRQIIKYKN